MQRLATAIKKRSPRMVRIEMSVVHQPPKTPVETRALSPGVRAWA